MAEKFFFIVFAVLAVGGALGVITRSNIVHALLLLVFTFVNVAAIYMLTQAYFLAVIQVLVYAGAILVLFAFVVMFLNLREFWSRSRLHRSQRWVVLVLAPIMLAEFVFVALGITWASVQGWHGLRRRCWPPAATHASSGWSSSTTCCCPSRWRR